MVVSQLTRSRQRPLLKLLNPVRHPESNGGDRRTGYWAIWLNTSQQSMALRIYERETLLHLSRGDFFAIAVLQSPKPENWFHTTALKQHHGAFTKFISQSFCLPLNSIWGNIITPPIDISASVRKWLAGAKKLTLSLLRE